MKNTFELLLIWFAFRAKSHSKLRLSFATILFGSVLIFSCGPSAQKVKDSQETADKEKADYQQMQKDSIEDFESFKLAYEARIDANEKTIADLKKEIRKDKSKMQEINLKAMDELDGRNFEMRKRIREFKNDSKEDWKSFKEEFSYDMDEIGKAIKGIGVNNSK
jgi:hypothetical protein